MKTPRELLFARHRAAAPKLDALRREALETMKTPQPESAPVSLREFLLSLRWHLAGMSALWLFIVFLHFDANRAPEMMASIPSAKIPSPEIIMASLRENRRQLFEMMESHPFEGRPRESFLPKPHSERQTETLMA